MSKRIKSSHVSLFAFQDVMASVIGILFFLVLLLSLQIANPSTMDEQEECSFDSKNYEELRNNLQQQIETLDAKLLILTSNLNLVSRGDDQIYKDILKAKEIFEKSKERLEADIHRLKNLIETSATKSQEVSELTNQILSIETMISNRETELSNLDQSPLVTFIVDDNSTKKIPMLLEVTNSKIRASDLKTTVIIDFDMKEHNAIDDVILWATNYNSDNYYFVIFEKPSGFDVSNELQDRLESCGFNIGVDLIPEHQIIY